jgi:hypothetical protein
LNSQPTQDSYEQQLKKITDIQDDSIDILHGIITMNEETLTVGREAAERLAMQRDKLNKIRSEMNELESGIARSKRELNAFIRGLACDNCLGKVVILIVIILAAGILALVIMRLVKPDVFNMANMFTDAPTPVPTDIPIQTMRFL